MFIPAQNAPAGCARQRCQARPWVRWLARVLCGWCLLASLAAGLAQDSVSKEYQIKAAYLYNFAKFVEWPAESFTNSQSPLVIGVFGQNPFGDEFQMIAKDHKINGRDIVFKPVSTAAEAQGVHLIFFGATEDDHVAETLAALKNAHVLAVGESDKFIAAGGDINFVREADKVRFEINAAAAGRHGLKISAQLLKLAKFVRKQP
jgi:hypothetical protein